MSRKYAYIDEFGAFGYQFDNPSVSTHFIISAVIVDEEALPLIEVEAEKIRAKHFQQGEMKSSNIASNHTRRRCLLADLMKLPFKILVFVADKRKIYENSGLRYKQPFYKFLNNYIHEELRISFSQLTVFADENGSNEFMQSFSDYFESKKIPSSLFDDCEFDFKRSNQSVLVQLADIISGSLAFNYDEHKLTNAQGNDYVKVLNPKILRIKYFPETYESFIVAENAISKNYNKDIADICYRRAINFIETNSKNNKEEVRQQVVVLKYLLFRFMNNDKRQYISTKELINQLQYAGFEKLSIHTFRNKIIAQLRDNDVIISSSPNGYKIPSTEEELLNFINHGQSIIIPMLARLKKCNDIIKLGTTGKINLLQNPEYHSLRKFIDD